MTNAGTNATRVTMPPGIASASQACAWWWFVS